MRNTKQKKLIYELVNTSCEHMSANEIYEKAREKIHNISLGTVYRILNELVMKHKILRITTKFGVDRFDRISDKKHHHFVCDNCGKIFDIFSSKCIYDKKELKQFKVDHIEVTFNGLCNDCQKGRK